MPDNADMLEKRYLQTKPNRQQYNFSEHMENYSVESTALHRKLQSKTDALRIMRKELERFRTERDQFKLMAETLQLRYSALTRHSDPALNNLSSSSTTTVAKLLRETRERNMGLTTEVEALKQKVCELQGDIKILRENDKRYNSQTTCSNSFPVLQAAAEEQWKQDRANFISHLENLKRKNAQLVFDMKTLIDEKQELITERDAYKCKSHRLNHELRNALHANEKHPQLIDIDSIVLENKFLHECLKNKENELEILKQSTNKYKTMLENKKKKGIMRLEMNGHSNDGSLLSHKQIKSLLENGIELPTRTETIQDLKSLSLILLDTLNDKNLALCHQRKANKMLAVKVTELERRMLCLLGDNASESESFSPSETLLRMYCPASVDSSTNTTELPSISTDISVVNVNDTRATTSTEVARAEGEKPCEDAFSSSNSESARSITSSEYDGSETLTCNLKSLKNAAIYAYNTPSSASSKENNGLTKQS